MSREENLTLPFKTENVEGTLDAMVPYRMHETTDKHKWALADDRALRVLRVGYRATRSKLSDGEIRRHWELIRRNDRHEES